MSDICKSAKRHSRRLSGKELNDQSLRFVEKFCCLGEIIGARGGTADSIFTWIKNEWIKFTALVPFISQQRFIFRNKRQIIFRMHK